MRGIGVVVISRNEGAFLRRTVDNLEDTLPGSSSVVVVDDGSTDGSADFLAERNGRARLVRARNLGVARARNLGASRCRGDVVVFADAHIALQADWWRPLVEIVQQPGVGAAAPAIVNLGSAPRIGYGMQFKGPSLDVRWFHRKPKAPCAAPILPGCCFAMRREVFQAAGGWDEGQLQRGNVDTEGCVRLWLLGYELIVTPETVVGHLFRKRSPYPVGWAEYLHNRMRLAWIHLNPERAGKVVAALRHSPRFGEALWLLLDGGVAARRREMLAARVRDDDWLFERFGMRW